MINITRKTQGAGWDCVVQLDGTPAKYYAPLGLGADSPHVRGEGDSPHAALDDALRALGLATISNPVDAGR